MATDSTIPTLTKAVRVMEALAAGGPSTSAALARRLGISQSTCYRILRSLEAAGWIRQEDGGGYRFGLGLLPYVEPLMGLQQAMAMLRPAMRELARDLGLTVKLSAAEGVEQVTLARVEAPRPLTMTSPVGARYPVVLGASGACLLSGLEEDAITRLIDYATREGLWGHESATALRERIAACRRDGVCDNLDSHPQGIDTVSAPVAAPAGTLALTLVGLRGDFAGDRLATCRDRLRGAAQTATRKLNH